MQKRYKKYLIQKRLEAKENIFKIAFELQIPIWTVFSVQRELKAENGNRNEEFEKTITEMKEKIDKLRKEGKLEEAEQMAHKVLELVPDDVKCKGRLMRVLLEHAKRTDDEELRRRKLTELEELGNGILENNPQNIPTLVYMLEVYKMQSKVQEAEEVEDRLKKFEAELKGIVENDISYGDGRTDLIRIYKVLGKIDDLYELLERTIKSYPDDISAKIELIRVCRVKGYLDREIDLQIELLSRLENSKKGFIRLAELYDKKEDFYKRDEMREAIRQLDPRDMQCRKELLRTCVNVRDDYRRGPLLMELVQITSEKLKEREGADSEDFEYTAFLVRENLKYRKGLVEVYERIINNQYMPLEEKKEAREKLEVELKEIIRIVFLGDEDKAKFEDFIDYGVKIFESYEILKRSGLSVEKIEKMNNDIEIVANRVLAIDPNNIEAHIALYRIYIERGMLREALSMIRDIEEQKDTNKAVASVVAEIKPFQRKLEKKGIDFSGAVQALTDEQEKEVNLATQIMRLREYSRLGRLDVAEVIAREILEVAPENVFAKTVVEYIDRGFGGFVLRENPAIETSYRSHAQYEVDDDDDDAR